MPAFPLSRMWFWCLRGGGWLLPLQPDTMGSERICINNVMLPVVGVLLFLFLRRRRDLNH